MTEEAAAFAEAEASIADREKCIKQHVPTAIKKQRYLSYHQATDLFIAGNVTRNISQRDTKTIFLIIVN